MVIKTLATYKRNTPSGALHRAKKIATDFNYEVKRIFQQFLSTGFLRSFIRTTVKYFNTNKDDFVIPEWLFDEQILINVELPFQESNEKFIKSFIKKLVIFTNIF